MSLARRASSTSFLASRDIFSRVLSRTKPFCWTMRSTTSRASSALAVERDIGRTRRRQRCLNKVERLEDVSRWANVRSVFAMRNLVHHLHGVGGNDESSKVIPSLFPVVESCYSRGPWIRSPDVWPDLMVCRVDRVSCWWFTSYSGLTRTDEQLWACSPTCYARGPAHSPAFILQIGPVSGRRPKHPLSPFARAKTNVEAYDPPSRIP